jgi:D-alanine-D-alanine ligase
MGGSRARVLLLFGGRSAEHEVSIVSARFIASALDRKRYEPVLVGIGKDGRWRLQDEAWLAQQTNPGTSKLADDGLAVSLDPMPPATGDPVRLRAADGSERAIDVVFPVLHGPQGEDGCMQGLLELIGIPYVGSGVTSSAAAMDKAMQKQIFEQLDLPVLPYRSLYRRDFLRAREQQLESCEELGYPMFVKPANMGSSLGISKATTGAELEQAIDHALLFDTKLVVEQGLEGAREIECSILGNDDPRVSSPGEIVVTHGDGFYSYDAKYIDDTGAKLVIPAKLFRAESDAVQLVALRAFRALDCSGLARVDLFVSPGHDVFLNEVNTIPGFTAISMYPRLWAQSGVAAEQLVDRLIALAFERHALRSALRTSRD